MKYIKLFENFEGKKYKFGDMYSENDVRGIVLTIDVNGNPLSICARRDLPSEILGLKRDQIKDTLSKKYSERDEIGSSNWRLPSTSEITSIKSNPAISKWDFNFDVPYLFSDEGSREYEQRIDDKLDYQLRGDKIYLYSLSQNDNPSLEDKLGKSDGRKGRVRMVYDLFKKHYDDAKRDFVTEPRK